MTSLSIDLDTTLVHPDGNTSPGTIELVWHTTDPLAVHMAIWNGHERVYWVLSRDLIAHGLHKPIAPAGGDFKVWPSRGCPTRLEIWLKPPSGRCVLLLDRVAVQAFIEATWQRIKPGDEPILVPDTVDEFLAETDGASS